MATTRPSFDNLPHEIILAILSFIPAGSLPAVQRTSRRLKQLADEPLLWRRLCRTEYHFWDSRHNFAVKLSGPLAAVDWKALYIERKQIDREVVAELNNILSSQQNRIGNIEAIVRKGYDSKDVLLQHCNCASNTEDVLARRFYAEAALSTMQRSMALGVWDKLRLQEDIYLEHALGGFDMFVLSSKEGDFDTIADSLDSLADGFRFRYPQHDGFSPRKKALCLAEYMRDQRFNGVPDAAYTQLQNNFIGIALTDHDHEALPLIQVSIYCCLAKRLNLDARPCGFPFHVYGIVYPPNGKTLNGFDCPPSQAQEQMYVDPFRSSLEVPVSDLQSMLRQMGAAPSSHSIYLGPATARELVLRTARNVMRSCQMLRQGNDGGGIGDLGPPAWYTARPDMDDAFYATLWAILLLGIGPADHDQPTFLARHHRQYLPYISSHFQTHYLWDVTLVEKYVMPLFRGMPEHNQLLEICQAIRGSDRMSKPVTRRNLENDSVKFKVGQMFRHRRYQYLGIVTGWDLRCIMEEAWIRQMNVDRLEKGRDQSFYHVLVNDKSVRYVAEENIEPVHHDPPASLLRLAGRHFKRWDDERKVFVSNVKDEYPDD